jgi:transcription elongation factor S-II
MKQLAKVHPNKKKVHVIAIKIENGLIKEFASRKAEYTNKSRTILANLMRSEEFKKRIVSGELSAESIATMDPKEMQDEALKKKRDEMEQSIVDAKRSDFMLANMNVKEGMYTCGRCKSKKTTFYEQQTRSADEPMTTFVNCIDCGHNMKF